MTYTSSPVIAWDYKNGPGDLMYIGSGGNTAMASQMALVVSDGHGFKVGKSGYDGSDFDISSTDEYLRITSGGSVNIGGDYSQTSSKLKVTGTVTVDGGFALSAGTFTAPGGFSISSGNVIIHQYLSLIHI